MLLNDKTGPSLPISISLYPILTVAFPPAPVYNNHKTHHIKAFKSTINQQEEKHYARFI